MQEGEEEGGIRLSYSIWIHGLAKSTHMPFDPSPVFV